MMVMMMMIMMMMIMTKIMIDGWPQVKAKGATINMKDLESDPLLAFQHRFYVPLVLFALFLAPTILPCCLWAESWVNAFLVAGVLR